MNISDNVKIINSDYYFFVDEKLHTLSNIISKSMEFNNFFGNLFQYTKTCYDV